MKKLNELNKKELQELAMKKGLNLSYKDQNGKRQRYTMIQLKEMIENFTMEEIEKTSEKQNSKEINISQRILNVKSIKELNQIKNEVISKYKKSQKIKIKSIKSKCAIEFNKLIFLINKKKLELN